MTQIDQQNNKNQENNRTMSTQITKVASKYMIGPKIGSGSFGQVFAVNLIGTTEIFALKREDQKSKSAQIIIQCKILKQMSTSPGYARVYWHGTQNKYNMMVMDMLGPSLEDLFEICGKTFSLKTTIMIMDQIIQRIQDLHNQNYLHRDIKPENFLMGIGKNSHIVYLIDFGLSKKYRDSKTMQHIPYKENKNLTGTARYASINAHLGIEQSRRDDLQAIGYVMLYFLQGFLPWQGIKANNKNEKYEKIMEKKMSIPIEVQCKGLPLEITTFLCYCRSLKFNDKPDYNFLRRTLYDLFVRESFSFDYAYDWTNLKQDQTLDNGKIKIEIHSTQQQDQGSHSQLSASNVNPNTLNPITLNTNNPISSIMSNNNTSNLNTSYQLALQTNQNNFNTQRKTKDVDLLGDENLLVGEENMSEDDICEENQDKDNKNIDIGIDLEEKKYQLRDQDEDNQDQFDYV